MRVIVIGAGAVGAASALALAEAGAEVVVVDRVGVAGETSSRCEGNILVSDKGPGAEAELAIVANRAWRSLAERLDDERGPGRPATEFEAKGGIVVAFPGGEGALADFAGTQRGIGIRAVELDAPELRSSSRTCRTRSAAASTTPTTRRCSRASRRRRCSRGRCASGRSCASPR
ncbi:hypothetical protein GCM10025870_32140 [Agromyces marinus]|uniref:FAD dependent oxidoreductase domain-containing protein n=1 Tax=Agromyces marinus TaxID=1389020 RepID=A0ABM8H5N7_9MICO|nr:hypothetical protein GCM10025870_32140 [Agromyces marinus]